MSRIGNRRVTLALICGLATLSPVATRADDAVDVKLDRVVDIERPFSAKLDDLFADLSKKFEMTITVDNAAFKREKLTYDGAQKASCPRAPGLRVRTVLEWILDQKDLRYEVRDNKVMVIPMTRGGKEVAFPPAKSKMTERQLSLKKAVSRNIDIEYAIDASAKDVLEFFEDRFDITIMLDNRAFVRHRNKKDVQETQIKFPATPILLRDALEDIAQKMDGTLEIRDDHIRITATPKK